MSRIDELVAALDGHEVTDDEGELAEETETPEETTTAPEPNEEEEEAEEEEAPEPAEEEEAESDEVEDDSGKKYVPIDRFKQVYGKMKAYQRKLEGAGALTEAEPEPEKEATPDKGDQRVPVGQPWDKADILEVKLRYPQFDPKEDDDGAPTNSEYSRELDELAYSYLMSSPGLDPMAAAQKALRTFKNLSNKETEIKTRAKKAKVDASEKPLASRSRSKGKDEIDPSKMTFEEKEQYLKEVGYFGS